MLRTRGVLRVYIRESDVFESDHLGSREKECCGKRATAELVRDRRPGFLEAVLFQPFGKLPGADIGPFRLGFQEQPEI